MPVSGHPSLGVPAPFLFHEGPTIERLRLISPDGTMLTVFQLLLGDLDPSSCEVESEEEPETTDDLRPGPARYSFTRAGCSSAGLSAKDTLPVAEARTRGRRRLGGRGSPIAGHCGGTIASPL